MTSTGPSRSPGPVTEHLGRSQPAAAQLFGALLGKLREPAFARAMAVGTGLGAVVLTGLWLGLPAAVLTLAGLSLLAGIYSLWSSLQGVAGDAPLSLEEALELGAPRAEAEQKRSVLRTLKDLEYERSVGKLSEEDFARLSADYRERARRLLRALDSDLAEVRVLAERRVRERLAQAGVSRAGTRSEPSAAAPSAVDAGCRCAGCGTANDADARFCKRCGQPVGVEAAS